MPPFPQNVIPVNRLRESLKGLSLEQFLLRQPDAVLLLRPPQQPAAAEGAKPGFRTVHIALFNAAPTPAPNELLCYPIVKRPGAVFGGQLTVGRTRNTDICIAHPKVSKLHAYFIRSGQGSTLHFQLVDAGSTNGTFVGEQRLERDEPKLLRDGDVLRFGQPHCAFYTPTGLHRLLQDGSDGVPHL